MYTEGKISTQKRKRIEQLRQILEQQQCRPVSHKEASEIGDDLLRFFDVLAKDEPSHGQED